MEIVVENGDQLIVRGSERVLILNRKARTISGLHGPLCSFDKICSIAITRNQQRTGDPKDREFSLYLRFGWLSGICLGSCDSESDVSIVAAHLTTWTGKPVRP